uniref:Uncharacterized protein n=1 Tax=Anser cygnoides TaxID=8845 RepID=A0A8B9DA74_ANSCY
PSIDCRNYGGITAHCCLGFYNVKCVLIMLERNRATPLSRGGCHSCVTAAPHQRPTNTAPGEHFMEAILCWPG